MVENLKSSDILAQIGMFLTTGYSRRGMTAMRERTQANISRIGYLASGVDCDV